MQWNIAVENNRVALQQFYAVVSQPKPKPKPKEIQSKPRINSKPQISTGTGRCGGDLPPCSVMMCESGGSLTAHNSSGADGKWQIIPPTWNNYKGYPSPSSAPEAIQDEKAREIYAGGAGRSAWSC